MELTYTTADGRLTVKIEGKTQIEIFEQLASFQEVFDTVACGEVNGKRITSNDIRYRVRESKFIDEKGKEQPATYYEQVIESGDLKYWKRSLGLKNDKSGNLFPHKAKEDPNIIAGEGGWHKYNGNFKKKEDS